MRKLFNKKRLIYPLAVALTIAVMGTGCEKNDNKVIDYGVADGTPATASDGTTDSVAVQGGLRERLGTENIVWQDSFESGGENYSVDIEYTIPDVERVPIYNFNLLSDVDSKEQEILDNLFEDNYSEVHENYMFDAQRMFTEEDYFDGELLDLSGKISYYWEGYSGMAADNNMEWQEADESEEFYNSWGDYKNNSVHTYRGMYENREYYAVFFLNRDDKFINFSLLPVDVSEFTDGKYEEYTYFYGVEYLYDSDGEFELTADETDNVCYEKKEEFLDMANDFINNKLASFGSMFLFQSYFSEIGFKSVQVRFFDHSYYDTDFLLDGYVFMANQQIADIYPIYLGSAIPASISQWYGSNSILISSKGILCVDDIRIYADYCAPYAEDTTLIGIDALKDTFKDIMMNEYDASKQVMKNVTFKSMEFDYYPLANPENDNEFTYVPVWVINAESNNQMIYSRVIINAVDGSLVYIEY
ncbi:MAG: hypothetical protein IJV15_01680 [Lachnospiraceae bacterium]|nr:hypothetical protein [Lachnospiraceae bacterium]